MFLADVNDDGNYDIVLTSNENGNTNEYQYGITVLLGNGDGTFQPQVQSVCTCGAPYQAVTVADVNGDGIPDVVMLTDRDQICVMLGNGNGTFMNPVTFNTGGETDTSATEPIGIALADFNNDGGLDIAAANSGSNGIAVFLKTPVAATDPGTTTSAPGAPTGVTASKDTYTDHVQISWTASSGAMGYDVWRSTTNDPTTAANITPGDTILTTFNDTTAVAGVTYYYWVKADNDGGSSAFSTGDSGIRALAVTTVAQVRPDNSYTTAQNLGADHRRPGQRRPLLRQRRELVPVHAHQPRRRLHAVQDHLHRRRRKDQGRPLRQPRPQRRHPRRR